MGQTIRNGSSLVMNDEHERGIRRTEAMARVATVAMIGAIIVLVLCIASVVQERYDCSRASCPEGAFPKYIDGQCRCMLFGRATLQ